FRSRPHGLVDGPAPPPQPSPGQGLLLYARDPQHRPGHRLGRNGLGSPGVAAGHGRVSHSGTPRGGGGGAMVPSGRPWPAGFRQLETKIYVFSFTTGRERRVNQVNGRTVVVTALLLLALWAAAGADLAAAQNFKPEYKLSVVPGPDTAWGMGAQRFADLV